MVRRIRLDRYETAQLNWTYYGAFRMRVVAAEAVGDDLDPYIFIYAHRPADPYTQASLDVFQAICGPAQMATIPIGAADPTNNYPFYRLDHVELDFTSRQEALNAWEIIKAETRILVEAMGHFTNMFNAETFWTPGPPGDDHHTSEG